MPPPLRKSEIIMQQNLVSASLTADNTKDIQMSLANIHNLNPLF